MSPVLYCYCYCYNVYCPDTILNMIDKNQRDISQVPRRKAPGLQSVLLLSYYLTSSVSNKVQQTFKAMLQINYHFTSSWHLHAGLITLLTSFSHTLLLYFSKCLDRPLNIYTYIYIIIFILYPLTCNKRGARWITRTTSSGIL